MTPLPEPVYTGWSSVQWNVSRTPLVDPVYTGMSLGDQANTYKLHWKTTGEACNCPTLEYRWGYSDYCSLHWIYQWTVVSSPHTHRHIKLSRAASMPVWNDKMTEQQAANGQVSVNSALLGVYCSPMRTSSSFQTCEHFNITLCLPGVCASS